MFYSMFYFTCDRSFTDERSSVMVGFVRNNTSECLVVVVAAADTVTMRRVVAAKTARQIQ